MTRVWTEERDNLLRRHYPKRDLDWVARRIGVSKAALKPPKEKRIVKHCEKEGDTQIARRKSARPDTPTQGNLFGDE